MTVSQSFFINRPDCFLINIPRYVIKKPLFPKSFCPIMVVVTFFMSPSGRGVLFMDIIDQIKGYTPDNAQEARDLLSITYAIEHFDDLFTRNNPLVHFTASAWIVNPERTHVLMAWHNIYRAWAWTGGHADGDRNLLNVALKEAREETGIAEIQPLSTDIYSIEALHVAPHFKRGNYISAHIHLNVTYLLKADDHQKIACNPDENSAVGWRSLKDAAESLEEPAMAPIYAKLNEKLRRFQ